MTELVSTVRKRLCGGCVGEMLIRLKDPTKTVTGSHFLRAVLVSEIALPGGLWKYTLEYDETLLVNPDEPIRACDYDLCCLDCQGQFFDEKLKGLEDGILLVDQEEDPIEITGRGTLFSKSGRPRWMDSTGRLHFERTDILPEDLDDLFSLTNPGVVFSGAKTKSGQVIFKGDEISFWYAYQDWVPDIAVTELNINVPLTIVGQGNLPFVATAYITTFEQLLCMRHNINTFIRRLDGTDFPALTSISLWVHGSYAW